MYDLAINNGKIVTSEETISGSIGINNGKIVAISSERIENARRIIDAKGLYILPGMIDEHVHCMDPGETEREDFIHCTKAAAFAGVTTIIEHTHSHPIKTVEDFIKKKEYIKNRSLVDFGFAAHVWPEYIDKLKELWDAGIVFFKIFTLTTHGVPGLSNSELYNAFREISKFDGRALVHAEDQSIVASNEKRIAEIKNVAELMQLWRSKEAEKVAAGNVSLISALTGATITIAHVSHADVIRIINAMKSLGAKVYVETCPQYIFLNYNSLVKLGQLGKFTPPARLPEDNKEMIEMIRNGYVDTIASDHAPSTKEQKLKADFMRAPFGIPGIQTTFYLMFSLVKKGLITINKLVQLYSENPAKFLKLYPKKGAIKIGSDADIIIVDPDYEWTISDDKILSKAGWSPYSGETVNGKVVYSILRGNVIIENGEIVAEPGIGKYVKEKSI